MLFFRLACPASLACRRFVTGLALLAYVASVTGYPLPVASGVRDTAVAYPCQGHACGCLSAEQCWDNCCCYSPAERLAWVRAHGVVIPAARLAALEAASDASLTAANSCCQRSKSCCEDDGSGDACSTDARHAAHDVEASKAPGRFTWIDGVQAQKCQGLTTLWVVCGANLPLEIPTLWEFDWMLAGRVSMIDARRESLSSAPAVPPPRA